MTDPQAMPGPTPELEKKKTKRESVVPTSFRFLPETLKRIDEGAEIFRMNRTKWLEFLIDAAISGKKIVISTERAKIEIEFTALNSTPRRKKSKDLFTIP